MKRLHICVMILAMISCTLQLNAQSTADPDSVCAGATGKSYKVTGTAGSTYQWFVAGGTQASGGTTDSITIDWSSTPGIDTLKVLEFNLIGCPGDTSRLAVVRLENPSVTLSGTDSICLNSATSTLHLQMTFTGVEPWTVNYLEDGVSRTITTSSNPYQFNSQVFNSSGIKTYSINTVTGRIGCSGTTSGSAAVTVFPKPVTSGITHY